MRSVFSILVKLYQTAYSATMCAMRGKGKAHREVRAASLLYVYGVRRRFIIQYACQLFFATEYDIGLFILSREICDVGLCLGPEGCARAARIFKEKSAGDLLRQNRLRCW